MLLTIAPSSRALDNTKQNRCDFNVSNPAPSDNPFLAASAKGDGMGSAIVGEDPGASGAGHHRFVAFDGPCDCRAVGQGGPAPGGTPAPPGRK
jgi:hypothetical protein